MNTDTPRTNEALATILEMDGYLSEDNAPDVLVKLSRTMERERDEWQINALLKLAVKQLACMWCGEIVHAPTGYDPGTPLSEEQRGQAYREHVATCQKHPIRDVERERDEARNERQAYKQLAIKHAQERDEARETSWFSNGIEYRKRNDYIEARNNLNPHWVVVDSQTNQKP